MRIEHWLRYWRQPVPGPGCLITRTSHSSESQRVTIPRARHLSMTRAFRLNGPKPRYFRWSIAPAPRRFGNGLAIEKKPLSWVPSRRRCSRIAPAPRRFGNGLAIEKKPLSWVPSRRRCSRGLPSAAPPRCSDTRPPAARRPRRPCLRSVATGRKSPPRTRPSRPRRHAGSPYINRFTVWLGMPRRGKPRATPRMLNSPK